MVELNLHQLLNLKFIKSEFPGTLAFDAEAKPFTIIEYRRDKTFSVVDPGYAYLSLMLNNKANFILEFNESQEGSLKRNDVD